MIVDQNGFLIVGIGASAGGIQALKRFFARVPGNSGIAYVVILHLSPEHLSHLAEVLATSAEIPVLQVTGRVQVEPNHVYVIPPNKSLQMQDGFLEASDVRRFEERRAPVDIFFRTLAESHHARAVSVILSGTGANGSMGMKRIKEMGGICIVQDPEEAEYSDMPRNSIATALVDHVLPVADIPGRILAYRDTVGAVHVPDVIAAPAQSDEQALRDIFSQLRNRTGHDFSNYKRATVLRRIARRMSLNDLTDLASYARFMRDHGGESRALLKDLLISVTNFFRDRDAFDGFERQVVPRLFEGKGEDDQVRVWIAGCATGEEAYSIAMLLAEHAASVPGSPDVQLFATDIDEDAIAAAREGLYTLNDAADVSPERLQRFFVKDGDCYRIRKELREMILFANHNLIKDPPFSRLDLISCRNLLIYLNRTAQNRVLEVMHFALNAGGFLFLGSSESVEGSGDLFVGFDKDCGLFQSRALAGRRGMPLPEVPVASDPADRGGREDRASEQRARERLSAADLHLRLLEQYAPPSVVVNQDHDIVHLSESAGRFMQFAGGEPSHNLLKAIRPELRIELRTALYQAAQQRTNVEARGLVVHLEDRTVTLNLLVRPVVKEDDTVRGFFLVIFEEVPHGAAGEQVARVTPLSTGDAARQLEEEVVRVKTQLRATIERHETQAEELKASNEELQAMNEELRSSAEELETSKEELQSLNEELRTVNQELKVKVEEQTQANDDIQNLINSTEIGTIFLDRTSRIKLFTPKARDIFTLIPADRGRPLSDISRSLIDVDLEQDVARVTDRLERVEREVRSGDGRWQLMRVLPYRTADDRIDGVVLTFVDITERKQAEEELRASENRLRLIIESVTDYAIFTTDAGGLIDSWNQGAARTFGWREEDVLGRPASMLYTPEDRDRNVPDQESSLAAQKGRAADERWHIRNDGSRFFASGVMVPLRADDESTVGFVKVARDLTGQRRWEDALEQAHSNLEVRVQERTAELGQANTSLDRELQERRQAEEQVRGLLRRLLTVQEDERRRIARDLHDHVGQQVAGLRLKIDALTEVSREHAELQAVVDDAQRTISRIDRDLDFFTWELRPASLTHLGLGTMLGNFVREWSKEFGIEADYHTGGLDGVKLSYEIEINLYRVAQEALNNIYKHAKAECVGVILERRRHQVVLIIDDDGVGFDRAERQMLDDRGIGLVGMQERTALIGGTLEIESTKGKGTTVFVQVPLPPEDDKAR